MNKKLKIHWDIIGWLALIAFLLIIAGAVEKFL